MEQETRGCLKEPVAIISGCVLLVRAQIRGRAMDRKLHRESMSSVFQRKKDGVDTQCVSCKLCR